MSDKILDALIAAKLPSEIILQVAKLIATAQATEDRRARNRERMRIVRTRALTEVHTETHGNTREAPLNSTSLSSLSSEKDKKEKKVSILGARLPTDWQASREDVEFARQHLPNDNAIADEESKFRDYWIACPGAKGRKIDWSATWRNWVRNSRRPQQKVNGNGHAKSGTERAFELADEWRRREANQKGFFGSDDDAGSH